MLKSVLSLWGICVIRYCYAYRVHYNLGCALLVNLLLTGWLIYGNVIYYSPENNCKELEETKGLNSLMLLFLILGYFQFLMFGVMICVLPCLIYYLIRVAARQNANESLDDSQIMRVANSLQRQEYDPSVHRHESECVVCLTPYASTDVVT